MGVCLCGTPCPGNCNIELVKSREGQPWELHLLAGRTAGLCLVTRTGVCPCGGSVGLADAAITR